MEVSKILSIAAALYSLYLSSSNKKRLEEQQEELSTATQRLTETDNNVDAIVSDIDTIVIHPEKFPANKDLKIDVVFRAGFCHARTDRWTYRVDLYITNLSETTDYQITAALCQPKIGSITVGAPGRIPAASLEYSPLNVYKNGGSVHIPLAVYNFSVNDKANYALREEFAKLFGVDYPMDLSNTKRRETKTTSTVYLRYGLPSVNTTAHAVAAYNNVPTTLRWVGTSFNDSSFDVGFYNEEKLVKLFDGLRPAE